MGRHQASCHQENSHFQSNINAVKMQYLQRNCKQMLMCFLQHVIRSISYLSANFLVLPSASVCQTHLCNAKTELQLNSQIDCIYKRAVSSVLRVTFRKYRRLWRLALFFCCQCPNPSVGVSITQQSLNSCVPQ